MVDLKRKEVSLCKDLIISNENTNVRYRDRLKYKGFITSKKGVVFYKFLDDDCVKNFYFIDTKFEIVYTNFKGRIIPVSDLKEILKKYN